MQPLRRSVLYLPGSNPRALEKAETIPADALILDLEDAVAPEAKETARQQVCAALRAGRYGHREVAVRVNALGSEWFGDDVRAVVEAGARAVVVPKVSSAEDVRQVDEKLGGAAIWAMLETPAAILDARAIAAASPRLSVLVMGTNDLAKELHAERVPGRAPLLTALSLALLAARAEGRAILDGVFNDVRDLAGFEAECRQARELGFDGKTLIHPAQVEPGNRVFTPGPAEVAQARAVLAAWDQARERGAGVATVDGRMIENLHVEEARRILAEAGAGAKAGAEAGLVAGPQS